MDKIEELTSSDHDYKMLVSYAVYHGNADILRVLIEKGVDVNFKDEQGRTPLMEAYSKLNADILELLVGQNADVDMIDPAVGLTPLMYCAQNCNAEFVGILLRDARNIDQQDDKGKTALMYAVLSGDMESTALLLRHGASISIQNNEGKTVAELNRRPKLEAQLQALLDGRHLAATIRPEATENPEMHVSF